MNDSEFQCFFFFFSAFNLTEHVLGRLVPLKEYMQKVSTPSTTDPPAAVAVVFILKRKILDFKVFSSLQ